jgi:protein TonB
MEPKKNPKYDIHRQRGVLLNFGLILSLVLVTTAFKWKVLLPKDFHYNFEELRAEGPVFDDPRITTIERDKPSVPKSVKPVVQFPTEFTESLNPALEHPATESPDQGAETFDLVSGSIEVPVEIAEPDTFRIVEIMPTPVGGWSAFQKTLGINIKYPRQAARIGVQGKVFVEFTVNAKGEPGHFKILKSIGHGCDEEARRVLSLTKWNPGKQRGKPVNVRMVQPITFSLSN